MGWFHSHDDGSHGHGHSHQHDVTPEEMAHASERDEYAGERHSPFERGELHEKDPTQFHGMSGARAEAHIPNAKYLEEVRRGLELGLQGADSIGDKTISTFRAWRVAALGGINTFLKFPYLEDVNKVGDYECAIMGVPFDIGTTYRAGHVSGRRRCAAFRRCIQLQLRDGARPAREPRCGGHRRCVDHCQHRKIVRPNFKAVSFVAGKGVFRL
jgi:hypothetical protein